MWTKTYIILSISSGEYITLGNRRSACSGCSVYAQTMHKPQNKSRDNLLELEWMWRHHYLQQKHLAVLLGIFHNKPAPTLAPGVSLFPDFTQVCLPRLSVFVVAESLQKASFFSFFTPVFGQILKQNSFLQAHLAFLHFLEGSLMRWASRPWDGKVTVVLQHRKNYWLLDYSDTHFHFIKHFMPEVAGTFLKQQ